MPKLGVRWAQGSAWIARECGRAGEIGGAKIAISVQAPAIVAPMIVSGWRQASAIE